jgi:bifunctional non-homologous end joining protein LigD
MISHAVHLDGHRLKLSNLDKVLYPAAEFTKAQVIDYYSRVAEVMLPHIRGRPISLRRYPNGVDGHSFFQKNCPGHRPDWMKTVQLPRSDQSEEMIDFCLIGDLPSLIWVANLASLEIHPYLHFAKQPQRPTLVAFDLDPGEGVPFSQVAQLALRLREVLGEHSLEAYPKTSGGKGLHVYIPLNRPKVDYEQTKGFARAVAAHLVRDDPKRAIDRMAKAARRGKVFIDWSQNSIHKTTVGVYSLRARDEPAVSTPVHWEEVQRWARSRREGPPRFLAADVLKRVQEEGDLFEPVLSRKQRLPVAAAVA